MQCLPSNTLPSSSFFCLLISGFHILASSVLALIVDTLHTLPQFSLLLCSLPEYTILYLIYSTTCHFGSVVGLSGGNFLRGVHKMLLVRLDGVTQLRPYRSSYIRFHFLLQISFLFHSELSCISFLYIYHFFVDSRNHLCKVVHPTSAASELLLERPALCSFLPLLPVD